MEQQHKNKDHIYSSSPFQNLTERTTPYNKQIDKQFSPWNSDDYRRFIQPRDYETLHHKNNLRKKKFNHPSNGSHSSNSRNVFGLRISHDFLNLVKLQRKGAFLHNETVDSKDKPMKMNLVNVSLDYDVIYSPEKKYGIPIMENSQIQKRLSRQLPSKQQPTKVRLSKQIRQKQIIAIQKKRQSGDTTALFQFNEAAQAHPQQMTFYPSMPKRLPKVKDHSQKFSNVLLEHERYELPLLQWQRPAALGGQIRQQAALYGKGSILQKSDKVKLRKMKYRSYLTKDHFKPHRKEQKKLFLYQTEQT